MSHIPKHDSFTVTMRDESVPRSEVVELLLVLSAAPLTARDLIAERVRAECHDRVRQMTGQRAHPLVPSGLKEAALNPARAARHIDEDRQIAVALKGFAENAFIMLVDDRQVEALDARIALDETSVVTFLKLTPLVGG